MSINDKKGKRRPLVKDLATEDKQDDIITEVAKGLIGNTQADGAGTKYHITTDSSGRIHTRSFKNAAGDGRRMLVDSDRHGQIDVLTSALPSGAATEAKQLADGHNITVSNPTTNPETGLAKETKQDNIITELQKLIGFEITKYDYIVLTYVAAGNGAGEIETVVYKTGGSGGTTVATLTLAYNGDNEISSITKT